MVHPTDEPIDDQTVQFAQPPRREPVSNELVVRDSFASNEIARPDLREGLQPTVLSYYANRRAQWLLSAVAMSAVIAVALASAELVAANWLWPMIFVAGIVGYFMSGAEQVVFADSGINRRGRTKAHVDWDEVAHLVIVRGGVANKLGGGVDHRAAALHLILKPETGREPVVMHVEAEKANRFAQWAQAKSVPTTWLDATEDLDWRDRLGQIGPGEPLGHT